MCAIVRKVLSVTHINKKATRLQYNTTHWCDKRNNVVVMVDFSTAKQNHVLWRKPKSLNRVGN